MTNAIAYAIIWLNMSDELIRAIKDHLERNKISQEEFAHKVGISFSTLNRWLNKKTKPKSKLVIEAIKRELG